MITVRQEKVEDYEEVFRINELAFERPAEAMLVEKLRLAAPHISLVAEKDSQLVGHIFFSPVSIESEKENFSAMGLAPMAVLPEFQNQGIGSKLIKIGLEECLKQGFDIVVVLGHPEYYPRFGFVVAATKGIKCEYEVPDEAFMIAELRPNALQGKIGLVKYRQEFAEV